LQNRKSGGWRHRTRDLVEKKFGYRAKDMVESFLPVGSIQTLVTVKDKAGKFGRILGKFKIHDGKEDRQTTINEWMIENHYAVAYFGQSKEAIADEHLINYEKVIENVDLTESELALYINSRS
jgi:endonuclease YncB( thermonuclease family)